MPAADILARVQKLAIDNSPQILTAIGVVGTVTTALLTGRAAFRVGLDANAGHYEPLLEGLEPESLEPKDLIKRYWKDFIPPITTGTLTIVCILGANHIGTRRAAGLAAAYSLSERAFTEYREKVVERVGVKQEQSVRDEIAQDRVSATPGSREVIISGTKVLCLDSYTGRYFESDMETLKKAQNDTNYQILNDMYATLTDFYDRIGLAKTRFSDEVGWSNSELLELEFSTALTDDQKPCLVVTFKASPVRDYYQFH